MKVLPIKQIKQPHTALNLVKLNFDKKLILPIEQKVYFLDFDKIILAYSDSNYIYVVTQQKKYFLARTLKWLAERLPKDSFIRVHRSYVINTNHICNLDKSIWEIVMSNNTSIPVSRSGRSRLTALLKNL